MAARLCLSLVVLSLAVEVSGFSRRRTGPTPAPTPRPPPPSNFTDAIQEQLNAVLAQYRTTFPNLAISVAYMDAGHEVAVSSGKPATINREIVAEDTFLYGSGTKPFTATAILRLIDQGKLKATDKVSSIVDPYLKAQGQPSLDSFFGPNFGDATVLELIRMGAGIRDFEDDFTFDQWCLAPQNSSKFDSTYPYDAMAWSSGSQNAKGGGPLYCNPGTCTAYSSTSYEVAGLVLAATLKPSGAWYDFDLGSALFDDRSAYPSMLFPPLGHNTNKLSSYLTVPGQSTASTWPKTTIFEQSPTILGWTCGNMVAAPKDVAKFFYHLLDVDVAHADPKPLISDASRSEMTNLQTLTTGWNAGRLKYGAGLMSLSYGDRTARIPVVGHEGDTYGFLSSQGYVPSMKAAYSVATNVDNPFPMKTMVSKMLTTLTMMRDSTSVLV